MKTAKPKVVSQRKQIARAEEATYPRYAFRLVFSGPHELMENIDNIENGLFDAGCGDALLGAVDGVVSLVFDREAPTFRAALLSAIFDVERAGVGLELARVEHEDPL